MGLRYGYLCGFQFIYKRKSTGRVVRSPVVGEANAPDLVLAELLVLQGEQVEFRKFAHGTMTFGTTFRRRVSCKVRGEFDLMYNQELQGIKAEGNRMSWTLKGIYAGAILDGKFRDNEEMLDLIPQRVLKYIEREVGTLGTEEASCFGNSCRVLSDRIEAARISICDIESRRLVSAADATAKMSEILDIINSSASKPSRVRFWASAKSKSMSVDLVEEQVELLESEVQRLKEAEETSEFDQFLQRVKDVSGVLTATGDSRYLRDKKRIGVHGVRFIIQSRIEANEFDVAARLCKRAWGAVDLKDGLIELALEACSVRDEDSFEKARRGPSLAAVLSSLPVYPKQHTALHSVADKRHFHLMELLLVHAQMDPLVREDDTRKRPIDLIGELSEEEKNDGEIKRIFYLLTQCTKSKEFEQRATTSLKLGIATHKTLAELLANVTAVQDLQVLLSLGPPSLTTNQLRLLLRDAFQHVISNKLVFDDDAAVCFKLGLEQCFSKRYITKKELEYWRIKTAQVNMESAPWVTEMQAAIRTIQTQVKTLETNAQILKTHFEKLRLALIQKEEEEKQRERRQKIVSLLSLGLVFAGGPVIRELMNGVMDLADPVHLLSATLELAGTDEIAKFCATDGANVVFRAGIDKLLERSDIAPMEFASVLKDAVVLEHPEFVADRKVAQSMNWGEENRGSATKQPEDAGYPRRAEVSASRHKRLESYDRKVAQSTSWSEEKTGLGSKLHEVADCSSTGALTSLVHTVDTHKSGREDSEQVVEEVRVPTAQDFETQQLDDFPYHFAVLDSDGDLDEFIELSKFVDREGYDVNQGHEVVVRSMESTSEYKRLMLPPHMFASYLGYIDIVKHLVLRKDFKAPEGGERIVVTMRRARKVAKAARFS